MLGLIYLSTPLVVLTKRDVKNLDSVIVCSSYLNLPLYLIIYSGCSEEEKNINKSSSMRIGSSQLLLWIPPNEEFIPNLVAPFHGK